METTQQRRSGARPSLEAGLRALLPASSPDVCQSMSSVAPVRVLLGGRRAQWKYRWDVHHAPTWPDGRSHPTDGRATGRSERTGVSVPSSLESRSVVRAGALADVGHYLRPRVVDVGVEEIRLTSPAGSSRPAMCCPRSGPLFSSCAFMRAPGPGTAFGVRVLTVSYHVVTVAGTAPPPSRVPVRGRRYVRPTAVQRYQLEVGKEAAAESESETARGPQFARNHTSGIPLYRL